MNRHQKEELISALRGTFDSARGSFLVSYRGLTVDEMQSLRSGLRQKGGTLKVAKVRLFKRAAEGVEGADGLIPFMQEQLGVVFATEEPPAVAKFLHEYSKGHEKLQLLAGSIDTEIFGAAEVARVALLPSREILLAMLMGTLNAPMGNFVRVLSMLQLKLLWTLKAIAEKKQ